MRLTAPLAQALTNLRGNKDFAAVLEGISENVQDELTRCTEGDGPVLYRAQGATKTLKWWLDAYQEAPTVLEKFKKHPAK